MMFHRSVTLHQFHTAYLYQHLFGMIYSAILYISVMSTTTITTSVFGYHYARYQKVPLLFWCKIFHTGCHSCHLTNNVIALNG